MMLVLLVALGACSRELPKRWSELHLPTRGLTEVLKTTDEHGYYADYTLEVAPTLLDTVSAALTRARYAPACTTLDGYVRGFVRGKSRLAVKVDVLRYKVGLSIFDENGNEPIIHGLCFGRYRISEPETVPRPPRTRPPILNSTH
jgi:hypothetical protein